MNEDLTTRTKDGAHGVDGGALSAGVIRLSPLPPPPTNGCGVGFWNPRDSSSRAPAE